MPEQSSLPGGDAEADASGGGVAALAQAALNAPSPSPGAESEARERALAQFQEMPPASRPLHTEAAPGSRRGWVRRALRRFLGK